MTDRNASHLTRPTYGGLGDLLEDLQRVTAEIRSAAAGQLLVPVDDLEFLTRRADYLAAGAVTYLHDIAEIPPERQDRHLEAVTDQ